jgi:putative flippase GtrA
MLTVDLRSISLLRIAVAFILIIDLSIRISDLNLFYTDNGALPRTYLHAYYWNPDYFSFHTFSGSPFFEIVLFAVQFVVAAGLLVGFQTRICTILSWLLLLSLHNRNPLVLQGGDDLLRLMLFWGIFLPWNKRYSFDCRRKKNQAVFFRESSFTGIAVLGYILLIFSVYFFSALLKNSPEWRIDGTALYYAFSLDMIAYPTAKYLLHYPSFLKVATYAVAYLELIVPVLLLIPFRVNAIRLTTIVLFTLFHLLIGITLFVGLFPVIGIVTLIGLLPSSVINKLEESVNKIFTSRKKGVRESVQHSAQTLSGPGFFRHVAFKSTADSFLLFMIIYSIMWNVTNLPFFHYKLNPWLKRPAYALRFDQNWGMFAPTVFKDDGWFVFEGITSSKNAIDIRQKGKAATYHKPANEVFNYKNDRWRKYSENYLFIKNIPLRPPFCSYLLKDWNDKNPEQQIDSLSIIYFKEISVADTQTPKNTKEVLCTCK